MITKPIPCPKCGKPLNVADDQYDAPYHCYVVKVFCDCGYGGMMQIAAEWVDSGCTNTPTK